LERKESNYFADDMILHVETLTILDIHKHTHTHTHTLWELIHEFSKVAGYKVNTQKSAAFLHTNNEKSKKEITKTIPLTAASNRIKYKGIYLTKMVKDVDDEKYKTLLEEIKEDID